MRQLLESGVHFGHQTRRWNPKMKRFIFAERNGIYIIDLQQSLLYIDTAYEFIKETVAHGGTVLFVGTKKQAQEAIAEQARRVGMPYVNQRWLGGMLTNFSTVFKRLQRLKELEEIDFDDVIGSGMTKKELLHLKRERDKLDRTLGGIRDMSRVPSALWVVDTKKEHIAVSEARKLGIPVVAILDTNCDPDEVTYPIPGNDDAIRSVALLTRVVADAVADGLIARAGAASGEEKPHADRASAEIGAEEPLAEWERELLEGAQRENEPVVEGAEDAEGSTEPADQEPADPAPKPVRLTAKPTPRSAPREKRRPHKADRVERQAGSPRSGNGSPQRGGTGTPRHRTREHTNAAAQEQRSTRTPQHTNAAAREHRSTGCGCRTGPDRAVAVSDDAGRPKPGSRSAGIHSQTDTDSERPKYGEHHSRGGQAAPRAYRCRNARLQEGP